MIRKGFVAPRRIDQPQQLSGTVLSKAEPEASVPVAAYTEATQEGSVQVAASLLRQHVPFKGPSLGFKAPAASAEFIMTKTSTTLLKPTVAGKENLGPSTISNPTEKPAAASQVTDQQTCWLVLYTKKELLDKVGALSYALMLQ